jgi:hypothetical protein
MVVGDLNVQGTLVPSKAHPVLIVDSNYELPLSLALQSVQPISRRALQVFQPCCAIQHQQLALRYLANLGRRYFAAPAGLPEFESLAICEGLDQDEQTITLTNNHVKHDARIA